MQEYRAARALRPDWQRSRFDRAYGVDTDGDIAGWTYLSDLNIHSPNWIEGSDYRPIEPERFSECFASLDIPFEDFTFIDFGSGKGRALLMALDLPFRHVIGLEFSAELHQAAQRNIRCTSGRRRDRGGWSRAAWTLRIFVLPAEPCVLYFNHPCTEAVFIPVLEKIRRSLEEHPRDLWLVYLEPGLKEKLLDAAKFLVKVGRSEKHLYCWYRSR